MALTKTAKKKWTTKPDITAKDTQQEAVNPEETNEATNWFIDKPFDANKKEGVELIGDYQARWNAYTGKSKPEARVTAASSVGDAAKNILEKADHGFEQRLRMGIDARIGDSTNVTILGSAAGMSGVDTAYDAAGSKGLNEQRLEKAEVTQNVKKWDFTAGRLTEPMGVTGYWFDKEYDGGRAVWTNKKTQVRIGYGDFSHSTGITDSAYTHAMRQVFFRAPTKTEWLGYDTNDNPEPGTYSDKVVCADGYQGMYQKLAQAASLEEQQQIINQYLEVIKQDDPAAYDKITSIKLAPSVTTFAWKKITVTVEGTGEKVGDYIVMVNPSANSEFKTTETVPYADLFVQEALEACGKDMGQDCTTFGSKRGTKRSGQ